MTPTEIVQRLLEGEEDDFLERHVDMIADQYQQISGDRDWWAYGGTFYNPVKNEIVHIDGLEGSGIKDVEPWDVELDEQQTAAIMADYPVVADENGDDENEYERDQVIDSLKCEIASRKNAEEKQTVYRFTDETVHADEWYNAEDLARQFEEGQWENFPTYVKWDMIGQHHGYHELDHYPDQFTKEELEKYLGLKS